MFQKYPKIYGLHNVVKNHVQRKRYNPDIEDKIAYAAKIKLHGTNAAIRVNLNTGEVTAQKRSGDVSVEDDNYGFASWVKSVEHMLNKREFFDSYADIIAIQGEWAGPGVQKNVAVSQIPEKTFFIFSITEISLPDQGESVHKTFDPYRISIKRTLPDEFVDSTQVRILPWYDRGRKFVVNLQDRNALNTLAEWANEEVQKIDQVDPYIKEEFGVEGHGEGLVFYPFEYDDGVDGFRVSLSSEYMFKVKGEKHATNKAGKAAKVDIVLPNELFELVDQVVTEARLLQGLEETGATEKSDVGKLIGWVCKDTMEECRDEFEAFGVPIKKVQGPIAAKTREWLFKRLEEF